jgi:transposase
MSTTQIHQAQINQQPTIWTVPDDLWQRIQPKLVINKPRKKTGRPRHPDRPIFDGIIHMARTGSQWVSFPKELAKKSTAFDRFSEWVEHGAFQQAWMILLEEYDELIGIEWSWQSADSCSVKAPLGKKGISARRKTPLVTQQTEEKRVAKGMC